MAMIISIFGIGLCLFLPNQLIQFMSLSLIYALLLFFMILLSSIVVYKFHSSHKTGQINLAGLRNHKLLTILLMYSTIGLYLVSLLFDLLFLNSLFYSILMLMVGFLISALLATYSYRMALFCVLFLFLSNIIAIYCFYPPSLGNDTFRDIGMSLSVVNEGFIGDISHGAYPLSIVPTLYSTLSLVLGMSPVYASALMGAIYVVLVASLSFSISKKIGPKISSFSSFMVILATLSIPLISLWGVWFIPEAYAFIMFLSILAILTSANSNKTSILVFLPLLIAMVVGHGGVNLWCIGFLFFLVIMIKFWSAACLNYALIKKTLLVLTIIMTVYIAYTTLLEILTNGVTNIFYIIFKSATLAPIDSVLPVSVVDSPFTTALFSYVPMVIVIVISFIAWVANKGLRGDFNKVLIETVFLYSVVLVGVGFLGLIYAPEAVLDRYLAFGSLLLLSILSPIGFSELLKRGLIGKLFYAILTLLLVTSMGFGAVFTPNFNPFNAENTYSVQNPPTWSDKISIDTISSCVDNGFIMTDWRTGLLMTYTFLDQSYSHNASVAPSRVGNKLYLKQGIVEMTTLGTYSLTATYDSIVGHIDGGGLFIYRTGVLDSLNLLVGVNECELTRRLLSNYNRVYVGSIEAFA